MVLRSTIAALDNIMRFIFFPELYSRANKLKRIIQVGNGSAFFFIFGMCNWLFWYSTPSSSALFFGAENKIVRVRSADKSVHGMSRFVLVLLFYFSHRIVRVSHYRDLVASFRVAQLQIRSGQNGNHTTRILGGRPKQNGDFPYSISSPLPMRTIFIVDDRWWQRVLACAMVAQDIYHCHRCTQQW